MKIVKFASGLLAYVISVSLAGLIGVVPANAAVAAAVNLGSAASFAVLASDYATTGAPSTFNGNVGAGAAITTGAGNTIVGSMYSGEATTVGAGGSITGNVYSGAAITLGAGSSVLGFPYLSATPQYSDATNLYNSAMSSLNAAIADLYSRTATPITGTLDGLTLQRGVYSSVASLGLTGVLTLDAQNDSNAVFIIRSDSFFATAAGSQVVLANGAQAKNVFWAPGSYFTAGADSILRGNVLTTTYVSIGARAVIDGRLFSKSSYINFGEGDAGSVFGITGIGTTDIGASGTIASVLGLSQSAATAALSNAGFTLGAVTTTASGATAGNSGKVASQSATGANQPFANAVNLVLYAFVAPGALNKSKKVSIHFKPNLSKLSAKEKVKLQRLVAEIGPRVTGGTIFGYVQRSGRRDNDARLSRARAHVIARYLAVNGVNVPLLTKGKGALTASAKSRKAILTIRYLQ